MKAKRAGMRTDIIDMAAHYKALGMDKYRAWDQYIIDCGLKPQVDAKEFYAVYESVSPKECTETVEVDFEPTHYDLVRKQKCQIEQDELGVFYILWEDGSAGSNPPMIPPREDRFMEL